MKYITKAAIYTTLISIILAFTFSLIVGFNSFNLITGFTILLCLNLLAAIAIASSFSGDFAMFSLNKSTKSTQIIRREKIEASKGKINQFYFSTVILLIITLILNYLN